VNEELFAESIGSGLGQHFASTYLDVAGAAVHRVASSPLQPLFLQGLK